MEICGVRTIRSTPSICREGDAYPSAGRVVAMGVPGAVRTDERRTERRQRKKRQSFPILVTERWAGADPGVQAVSPQVT